MLQFSIIRPGFLVSLKTTVRGGVSYSRRDIAAPVATDGAPAAAADPAAEVSAWETVRAIADAAEHRRAIETRGRCRTLIVRHCAQSSFGLLCPEANEPALSAAIREAQNLADEFNRGARFSRVEVFTLAGRIADNDVQAARAISSEVRELVAAMESGIKAADPAAIREAADKARNLAGMLDPDVGAKVSDAIKAARTAAREIVKRAGKAGETAADVVASLQLESLQRARFAVLDFEAAATDAEAAAPAAAVDARALDLMPETAPDAAPAPAPVAAPVMPSLDIMGA